MLDNGSINYNVEINSKNWTLPFPVVNLMIFVNKMDNTQAGITSSLKEYCFVILKW